MRHSTFIWLVMIYLAMACSSAIAATIQLPATGQTSCFDSFGNLVPCAGTGQDADKLRGVAWPIPRFIDNANGTVTDNLTGLVWLKEANCLGFLDWTTALGSARSLASGACGLTDGSKAGEWRLPSIVELESLVDISQTAPALPASHPFVNVMPGLYFSSTALSTPYVFTRGVDMNDGRVAGVGIRDGFALAWPVRNAAVIALPRTGQTVCTTPATTDVGSSTTIACTNTGQDGETLSGIPWPTPRFSDNNDGTMTDNLTGLIWLKKADCFDLQTWQQALASSNNLASGLCGLNDASKAGAWRLPNRKEMLSLANHNTEFQMVNWLNTQGFSNAVVNLYWTSDTYIPLPTLKWSVTPQGHAFSLDSNAMAWLLPVRDPICCPARP